MTSFSLYQNMRKHGTLAEEPHDVPDAVFALSSTVHWMRALAILVVDSGLNYSSAAAFFRHVQKRNQSERAVNTVCEQLLFALHQLSSLEAISGCANKPDVARMGIVAWYYGIYVAASAMIAAADGSFPDTHTATANQWDRQLAATGLVMLPFADRVSSLVEKQAATDFAPIRSRGKHPLTRRPGTVAQAWGCCAEYLSGTVGWEQWNVRQRLTEHRDFKALGVTGFRTNAAKKLRDQWYSKRSVCFLHQASRYRGKANYRDAIYLAYGRNVSGHLDYYIGDLVCVLRGFVSMAGAYAAKRLGYSIWQAFLEDLESKRSITASPKVVWS